MKIDRRTSLKALGVAGIATAPTLGKALGASLPPPVAVVYSSRVPQSAAFGQTAPAGVLRVDSATRDLGLAWREEVRRALAKGAGRVEGLGLWSDLLISQGMGRELGLRLVHEAVVETGQTGLKLFRWSLA